jgi:hypothetical protein
MKFAKAYLPLAALALIGLRSADAAVAYSNLPTNPPFYSTNTGSTIFGSAQDPNNGGGSGSIAMSFVPNATGTITVVILGITFNMSADGNVNLFLASNPTTMAGMTTFGSEQALGTATTTSQFGTTNSALTTVSSPAPLQIFSGTTYYLVMTPSDANTSVVWNENVTGATSDYYSSADLGATFAFGGTFGSDALQIEVDMTAIPEPATWVPGAMLTGVLGLLGVRRLRFAQRRS